MGLLTFAAPTPHNIHLAVVGSPEAVHDVEQALDDLASDGFTVMPVLTRDAAAHLIQTNAAAAAYIVDPSGPPELIVSSAASSTRADYLETVTETTLNPVLATATNTLTDLVPRSDGDITGVGLFFYGLPLLLVGLITSIVLLQFPAWPWTSKLLLIAATGAFASIFSFTLAVSLNIVPFAPWLIVLGLALTQTIGWLTTAVAMVAKRFFMPISMTFVLILGIPSAGATLNADMLPPFVRALNQFLPFAQLIDATRATAYFLGEGSLKPIVILTVWMLLSATAFTSAHVLGQAKTSRIRLVGSHKQS